MQGGFEVSEGLGDGVPMHAFVTVTVTVGDAFAFALAFVVEGFGEVLGDAASASKATGVRAVGKALEGPLTAPVIPPDTFDAGTAFEVSCVLLFALGVSVVEGVAVTVAYVVEGLEAIEAAGLEECPMIKPTVTALATGDRRANAQRALLLTLRNLRSSGPSRQTTGA